MSIEHISSVQTVNVTFFFAVPKRLHITRNILAHGARELVALTDNDTTNEYELLDVEDSKYFRGMNILIWHHMYMAVDISHLFAFTF